MRRPITAGSTDQTIDIFVPDSSSLIGGGLTGLVYNTASLTCYFRKGATGTSTQLSLANQSVVGAHTDGGFREIDSTNMPGAYRLDLSDTMVDTAGNLLIYLQGATNMAPVVIEQPVSFPAQETDKTGFSISGTLNTLDDLENITTAQVNAEVVDALGDLENLSASQVNAEMVDVLNTDTYAEPGQGTPASTTTLAQKISYLYKAWRNKSTQDTSGNFYLYADDASTVDHKATISDDGTTFTRGELTSGP